MGKYFGQETLFSFSDGKLGNLGELLEKDL